MSYFFVHPIHFEDNTSRKNIEAISLRVTLAFSHSDFCSFGGKRSVRKNANPIFTGFSQRARDNFTERFILGSFHAGLLPGLQAIRAKGKLRASSVWRKSLWIAASCLPFSKFY